MVVVSDQILRIQKASVNVDNYKHMLTVHQPISVSQFSKNFCVVDPQKSLKGDYIEYLVVGEDNEGHYEVWRRYREFNILRQALQ